MAKGDRYSISVSGKTYDRLRAVMPHGSLASCVDELVADVLDDPEALARVVEQCRIHEDYS